MVCVYIVILEYSEVTLGTREESTYARVEVLWFIHTAVSGTGTGIGTDIMQKPSILAMSGAT